MPDKIRRVTKYTFLNLFTNEESPHLCDNIYFLHTITRETPSSVSAADEAQRDGEQPFRPPRGKRWRPATSRPEGPSKCGQAQ